MGHIANIERFIPDLKSRKILDLGCGRGAVLLDFARRGYEVVGIDRNKAYLDIIQERADEEHVSVTICHGFVENLPFKNEEFGFINCNEVTEHVAHLEKLLFECYRVLKDNGAMYISFHNRFGWYDYHYHLPFINLMPRSLAEIILNISGKSKKSGDAGKQKLSDMNYVTYGGMMRLFRRYNYKIIDTRFEKLMRMIQRSKITRLVFLIPGLKQSSWFVLKHVISSYHLIVIKKK